MGSLIPVFVAVVGAALTYIFTQRHERKRRSEQYQLEQIEHALKTMVLNAETSGAGEDSPGRAKILAESKVCMALLEIYGDEDVLKIVSSAPDGRVTGERANQLAEALQAQGRRLAYPKKWQW